MILHRIGVFVNLKNSLWIPKTTTKLEFPRVGFAANFLSSLAPCTRTMVARSRQKICAAALPNSTFQAAFSIQEALKFISVDFSNSCGSE